MNWETVWETVSEYCVKYAWKIVACIAVLIVGSLLIKLVTKKFLTGSAGGKLDPSAKAYGRMIARISLKIILAVIIVSILGIPVASVVTVIAAVGAAVALALQGSLSNVASGVILMASRPFRLGDWIEVGDDRLMGEVVDYGLFYTTIRTIEESNVVIPNSTLTSSVIVNLTAYGMRRTTFTVSAAYGSDTAKVKRVILEALASDERILTKPEPLAEMIKMNESSLDFCVRFYTNSEQYREVWYSVHELIYNAFKRSGVEIPFNQLDVHIKN